MSNYADAPCCVPTKKTGIMKKVFRIKYIVEMIIATVCVGVCAYWFYTYGINVPAHLGNPMLMLELIGIVAIVLAVIDQAVYEDAERWEE